MRITEAQARKLGLKIDAKKKTSKPDARVSGRDRHKVGGHGQASLVFNVPLTENPQPKERPRTVTDRDAIMLAFRQARGSAEKFSELIARRISRTYTPKNTADYEEIIRVHAVSAMAKAGMKPFDCPVRTHIHLVLTGDPETWPTSARDGDVDNLEKAILDALNKTVFTDDRLVVHGTRTKSCGERPMLRIEVAAMSDAPPPLGSD